MWKCFQNFVFNSLSNVCFCISNLNSLRHTHFGEIKLNCCDEVLEFGLVMMDRLSDGMGYECMVR